ncbi:MAG: DUF2955 domain-containing protein [Rhodobacteraceae bacterium]|nr:DUF2955 domain-containing protein [Paracoccaceae bacterium]
MGAAPPSFEIEHRRAMRLALGVTVTFTLTQLHAWPLSFLATVGTLVYLQDAKPMPVLEGIGTALKLFAALAAGFVISVWLGDYPVVLVLTLVSLLALIYRYVLTRGGHLIVIVGLLLGGTLVPMLTTLLPELGFVFIVYAGFSFVLAWFVSMVAFMLIPPPAEVPEAHHSDGFEDATPAAIQLAIVVGAILTFFLMSGRTDALTLVYSAIFAMTLSTAGSASMGLTYLRANLFYAAVAVLIVFELLTVVPFLPFAVVLFFLVIYIFARGFFGHSPTAGEWSSGAFGFIIILSGMLSSEKITASGKLFDRLVQIGTAAIFVTVAYALFEYFRQVHLNRANRHG